MHKTITDLAIEMAQVNNTMNKNSDMMSELRQFSHAEVTSVYPGYGKCDILFYKNGKKVSGAIVAIHPNFLNIVGYPRVGDTVLVYHQRDMLDCHIILRLHPKLKEFYEYETYANNCTLPAGALAG